jgi:chaperonin GroEL
MMTTRESVVKRALEELLWLVASNACHEGAVVVGAVRDSKQSNFGFNAATEEYTDMISAGILDLAKITRSALENAASIAGLMLTTEALVSEISEAEKAAPMRGGGAPMC